jgi:type IV pilus assembly protein PilY1
MDVVRSVVVLSVVAHQARPILRIRGFTLSTTSCANNLGLAKTYRVPLFCGVPESIELAGGGLPPSPVIGLVDVSYTAPGGGTATKTVPFIICGFSPELSGLAVSRVPINVDPTRKRTYWFTNKER